MQLTRAVNVSWGRYGIRAVTIAPGTFDTPLMGFLPDEQRQKLADATPFPPRLGRYAAASLSIVSECHSVENDILSRVVTDRRSLGGWQCTLHRTRCSTERPSVLMAPCAWLPSEVSLSPRDIAVGHSFGVGFFQKINKHSMIG